MGEGKIKRAARLARERGYTHLASVVKSVFDTTYYNVVSIEYILEHGWRSAPINSYPWYGRVGVTWANVPDGTLRRDVAISWLDTGGDKK